MTLKYTSDELNKIFLEMFFFTKVSQKHTKMYFKQKVNCVPKPLQEENLL